jgi:hypothetical protein
LEVLLDFNTHPSSVVMVSLPSDSSSLAWGIAGSLFQKWCKWVLVEWKLEVCFFLFKVCTVAVEIFDAGMSLRK